jgi:hypothetical protein
MMEKRQLLQKMLLWKLDICMQKLKLDPCLSPCTSINIKWIKDHNKTWNSESTARKIETKMELIGIENDFQNRILMVQQLEKVLTNGAT